MSDSEDRRIAVPEAATHHWGRDVAVTLMEMLPPSGWGDVATRRQLGALRDQMHREIDGLRADVHRGIARFRAEMRAELADTQRRTLQWMISTIIATTTLSTAIITLVR